MRPPYGYYDTKLENVIGSMGYKAFLWNLATRDWEKYDSPQELLTIVKIQLNKTSFSSKKRSILFLQHDTEKFTMLIQDEMIKYILNQNFTIVKLNECIGEAYEYNNLPEENIKSGLKKDVEVELKIAFNNNFYYKNFSDLSLNLYYFICVITVLCLIKVIFFYRQYLIMFFFKYLRLNSFFKCNSNIRRIIPNTRNYPRIKILKI